MSKTNRALDEVPLSAFVDIDARIAEAGHSRFLPLHQGKTPFAPPVTLGEWARGEFDLLSYQHASPLGAPSLKRAIQGFQWQHFNRDVPLDSLQIVNGGTHAMNVALHSILDPGDEVLVLCPQWLRAARDHVLNALEIPCTPATGGLYTFLDLSGWPGGDSTAFVHQAVRAGVSLAPGSAFGARCACYARLCFTAVPLADLKAAIRILNQVYLAKEVAREIDQACVTS